MGFQSHSQNTSTDDNRVRVTISPNGDTLVTMAYEDARILLNDVLKYEYTDSLLAAYVERDSLNMQTITFQKMILSNLSMANSNLETMLSNLEQVIENKDSEVDLMNSIIKEQRKEIRKQKVLKVIGFSSAIVLPIITLFITVK
jgi:hypothetical protein